MSIHKFIKRWVLPPMVYRSVGQFHFDYVAGASKEEKNIIIKNMQFEDKYRGKRCVVIGNGQSINKQNLLALQNEVTIVMNRIYLHDKCKELNPNFYCAVDRESDLKTPFGAQFLKNVFTGVFPIDGYFFHITAKPLMEQFIHRFFIKTDVSVDTLIDVDKPWDFINVLPGCRSTAQMAIMLAMYIGCNPIYLIGLDTDWLSHRGIDKHFYGGDSEDHNLEETSYGDLVLATSHQIRGYEVIKKYADKRGISIINSTEGGFLDVFPRKKFEDVFTV